MIPISIQAQSQCVPITLHLYPNLVLPEKTLQSLLSLTLDIPSTMTIVGLATRIALVEPTSTTATATATDNDCIVVALSSLANTPEYFAQVLNLEWLAVYESDDVDGYYYVNATGQPVSVQHNSTEGRGRPMSAVPSDKGRRLRPVRTEGKGRPLSAVPSDKNHGGRRLRPQRTEGYGRPTTPTGTVPRAWGGDAATKEDRRPSTAPSGVSRIPERSKWMAGDRGREAWTATTKSDDDWEDTSQGEESQEETASMHSMAVQLSAYGGSGADSTSEEGSYEEEAQYPDGDYPPFFDTEGSSISVSAWETDRKGGGGERRPRTVGLGPL